MSKKEKAELEATAALAVKTVNEQMKKEGTEMSTEQKQEETPKIETEKIEKTVKGVYDLSTLKPTDFKFSCEFIPADTPQSALARLGNDPKVILNILNDALRTKTIEDAKNSAAPAGVASKKTVMKAIESYRMNPSFSSLVTTEKGDEGWAKQRNLQTETILSQIISVPFIMDNLRAIAKAEGLTEDSADETGK